MYFSSRVHLVKAKKWRKRTQRIRKKGKGKERRGGGKRGGSGERSEGKQKS